MNPTEGNIHFVAKGKIGFVALPYGPRSSAKVGWIQRKTDESENRSKPKWFYGTSPFYQGNPLALELHLSHGDPVLILSEPMMLIKDSAHESNTYYHVLWKEIDCWVACVYIINPFHAESSRTL